MKKKTKIIFFLSISLSFIFLFFFSFKLINNTGGYAQKIKYLIPQNVRDILRETIYKNKYSQIELEKLNLKLNKVFNDDIAFKTQILKKIDNSTILSKNKKRYTIEKYSYPFYEHFSWGKKPPGYIAGYKDIVISMSGSGEILYFFKKDISEKEIKFNILESNFHSFVDIEKYLSKNLYGIRDISIKNNNIFVSYVDKESCDKLSILKGDINLNNITFEKFFSCQGCTEKKNETLIGQRSGGRIVSFDENHILFTIGDYSKTLFPPEPQKLNSLYGSLIKINLLNKKFSILGKGLRNSQGLFYDKINNLILLTDHGPNGGDEINSINLDKEKFVNFGWPISSYGKHYKSTISKVKSEGKLELLEKGAPLRKSHKKFGFKEPIKYWSPSIGISEIIKVPNSLSKNFTNDFFVAAMGGVIAEGDLTIHQIRLSNQNYQDVIYSDSLVIKERIRDIYFDKDLNSFILLLGTSPAIAILKFEN